MKYAEFKMQIQNALVENPDGLSWLELKGSLNIPYKIPCQTWIYKFEQEINFVRSNGRGSAFIWKIYK